MANESSPPITKRARGKWLRRTGLVLLAFLVLLVAGYLEENWRGARAWSACERDLAAQGEQLAWAPFIPPSIPDEQNLAMAPVFAREFKYRPDPKTGTYTFGVNTSGFSSKELRDMPYGLHGYKPSEGHLGGWETVQHTDLVPFAEDYRKKKEFPHSTQPQSAALDVLLALTRYESFLDELARSARERPLTRFPVNWYGRVPGAALAPHYSIYQGIFTTLALRASAQLATGAHEEALRDVALSLRLSRDLSAEPQLIAQLVEFVGVGLTFGPVWEGLADHCWTTAELARLQGELEHFDVLGRALNAFRAERASTLVLMDDLKSDRQALSLFLLPPTHELIPTNSAATISFASMLSYLIPPGWLDLNKVTHARWEQNALIGGIDVEERRISPEKVAAGAKSMNETPTRPSTAFAKLMTVVPTGLLRRVARTQTILDQASIACALERFQLDRGAYPTRLDELLPVYLDRVPNNIVAGTPMHYHPTLDGRYQLYCVGWNVRDDNGKVVWSRHARLDLEQGDWVWQYCELQPPSPPADTR